MMAARVTGRVSESPSAIGPLALCANCSLSTRDARMAPNELMNADGSAQARRPAQRNPRRRGRTQDGSPTLRKWLATPVLGQFALQSRRCRGDGDGRTAQRPTCRAGTGRDAYRRCVGSVPLGSRCGESAPDNFLHDFGRAAEDRRRPAVEVVLGHVVFTHVSVAAVQLHCPLDDFQM
jgi:hypothetical protein